MQHFHPLAFRPRNAHEPDQKLERQGQRADNVLIDAGDQLGIHVVGVKLKHLHFVVFGLHCQPESRAEPPLHHGDVGALQGTRPAARKQSIGIAGVLADALVGFVNSFVGQTKNATAHAGIFLGRVPTGQKPVVGVKSCIEQVLAVEFLKNRRVEQKGGRLGIAGMGGMKALKTVDCARKIQEIEAVEGVLDQGIEIERISVR